MVIILKNEFTLDIDEALKNRILELGGTLAQFEKADKLITEYSKRFKVDEISVALILLDTLQGESATVEHLELQLNIYQEKVNNGYKSSFNT